MPALARPVRDERHALGEFLSYQQGAFVAVAYGLTDDQARATPTASALSIGGLIKHATGMQRSWMRRVMAAPHEPAADTRTFEERQQEYTDEYVMRPDETLAQVLDGMPGRTSTRCVWSSQQISMPPSRSPGTPRGSRTTSTRGRCAGCFSTWSANWPGTPDMPTSSEKALTARPCTSSWRRWRNGSHNRG